MKKIDLLRRRHGTLKLKMFEITDGVQVENLSGMLKVFNLATEL